MTLRKFLEATIRFAERLDAWLDQKNAALRAKQAARATDNKTTAPTVSEKQASK